MGMYPTALRPLEPSKESSDTFCPSKYFLGSAAFWLADIGSQRASLSLSRPICQWEVAVSTQTCEDELG